MGLPSIHTLAQAMHYAHAQGVLHRDLKPSNVLVNSAGVPRITDFGLARQINQDTALTDSGDLLGTPGYLPPEQVSTKRGQVGPASDVYGLGAILYYLLTSRPPHLAGSAAEALRAVEESDPISPRRLNPSMPADLETICLKCLEKDMGRRCGTAQELADQLGKFLRGEPIDWHSVSHWTRAIKWVRRKPALASAIGFAAMVLVLGVTGIIWEGQIARTKRVEAEQTLKDLRKAESEKDAAYGAAMKATEEQKKAHELAKARFMEAQKAHEDAARAKTEAISAAARAEAASNQSVSNAVALVNVLQELTVATQKVERLTSELEAMNRLLRLNSTQTNSQPPPTGNLRSQIMSASNEVERARSEATNLTAKVQQLKAASSEAETLQIQLVAAAEAKRQKALEALETAERQDQLVFPFLNAAEQKELAMQTEQTKAQLLALSQAPDIVRSNMVQAIAAVIAASSHTPNPPDRRDEMPRENTRAKPATIAVAPVRGDSSGAAQFEKAGGGEALAQIFVKEFGDLGTFRTVENTNFQALKDEIRTGEDGWVEANKTSEGRTNGVDYVFVARVTRFGAPEKEFGGSGRTLPGVARFPPLSVKQSQNEVQLDWRLVDARTRAVVKTGRAVAREKGTSFDFSSAQGSGFMRDNQFQSSAIGKATMKAVAVVVDELRDFQPPQYKPLSAGSGQVLYAKDSKLIVSLGQNQGVGKGDKLGLFRVEETKDDNGAVLFIRHIPMGEVEVVGADADRSEVSYYGTTPARNGWIVKKTK